MIVYTSSSPLCAGSYGSIDREKAETTYGWAFMVLSVIFGFSCSEMGTAVGFRGRNGGCGWWSLNDVRRHLPELPNPNKTTPTLAVSPEYSTTSN